MAKLLVKITLFVAIVTALAVAVLIWNINPIINKLRPQIVAAISEAVHHPVVLGEISASLFPNVALEINDVGLADENGKALQDASARKLTLKTGLGGLLKGNVKVSEFSLEDASVKIVRSPLGELSIGGIALSPKQKDASIDPALRTVALQGGGEQTQASPPADGASVDFAVESANLENIRITFVDQQVKPAQEILVEDLSASAENISKSETGQIQLTATALGTEKKNISLSGSFSLAGGPGGLPNTNLDFSAKKLNLPAVIALANAYGTKIDGLTLSKTASIKAKFEIGNQGIRVIVDDLDASDAAVAFTNVLDKKSGLPAKLSFTAQPTLSGAVTASKVDLIFGDIVLAAPLSIQPGKGGQVHLTSSTLPLASLEQFLIPVRGMGLTGAIVPDIKVQLPEKKGSQPVLNGTIKLNNISADLPVNKETGATLPVRNTSGTVTLLGDKIELKPFASEIAGQKLTLTATINSLKSPNVSWALNTDQLDLEKLTTATGTKVAALAGAKLQGLKASGSFAKSSNSGNATATLASGTLAGTALSELALKSEFRLDKKNQPVSAKLMPSSFKAFGGTVAVSGGLSEQHFVAANVKATKLDLGALSGFAMSKSAFSIVGTLEEIQARVSFDKRQLTKTLSGPTSATASKGSVKGFNLLRETLGRIDSVPGVNGALTAYVPEKYRPLLSGDATEFDSLTYNANIRNGLVQLQNIKLLHALYIVEGQGEIGLDGKMNLKAQMKLTPALAEEMILKEPKLQLIADRDGNIVFPLVIKKDKRVLVFPDISQLLKRAVKNTAKDAVKRELDKVTPGLGQAIDSLFK